MLELVDMRYASAFQQYYDAFVETLRNFVQVGRYNRFWVTTEGALRVILVNVLKFFVAFSLILSFCDRSLFNPKVMF